MCLFDSTGVSSEQVALRHPVMPVANRLGSGFVRIDGSQLGKRHGHLTPLPTDQHEHVGGAGVFRRHTPDFDSVPLAERRDDFGSDALGLERESDFVIEIVIPAHRLLFRPVSVHDGLVVDAVFPDRVFLRFFHGFAARIRRTEVRPISSRRAISALLTPALYSFRTWLVWSAAVCGRPRRVPFCRAWARPARTRSRRISRSNSAKTASKAAMARPAGVVRSSASVRETNPTPRWSSSWRVASRSVTDLPQRSSRHTNTTSISRRRAASSSF